ncbi:hypothetical protein [Denitromonas iodatirespirans]|uniref:Uncharacterized protein n=1 Tax=Denitromonas iodatirespirans TaxID=2795389 RepID=A0A944DFK1_DENI1|nr:hypothetical protein [Denitromonas iodatirespirans]MBT0963448.1 hypothetical protein [Denitromonas iodatirespirans]
MKYTSILFIVLLVGCATHPRQTGHVVSTEEAVAHLHAQTCCADIRDLPTLPINEVGASFDFKVTATGKPIGISKGAAYGRLLTLPEDGRTYHFKIESFSSKIENRRQLFAPIVVVLNDDYSVSRVSSMPMLRVDDENPIWQEREHVTLFVKVNRKTRPHERRILITTDPGAYGKYLALRRIQGPEGPIYYVTKLTAEPTSTLLPHPIQASPEGELRLTNLSSVMSKPFDHWIMF